MGTGQILCRDRTRAAGDQIFWAPGRAAPRNVSLDDLTSLCLTLLRPCVVGCSVKPRGMPHGEPGIAKAMGHIVLDTRSKC